MIDKIKEILRQNNYSIIMERPIPYGCRLELNNGTIILIYPHKNKYCFQGINIEEVSRLLRDKLNKDNFDTDSLLADHDKEVRKQVCDDLALSLCHFTNELEMSRDEILMWLQKYKSQIEKGE